MSGREKLEPAAREKRIRMILTSLIGEDKTTMQISKTVPLGNLTIKNILINCKGLGYVSTDPPVADRKGWVVWKITPRGITRARGGYHE